ncbi:hypothetical protein Daus18300_010726 [Diaporthe australafricana]|uniref:Fungal-type protein kinase domain-containing protein n=1 Tax=Diaporthe australafricana TaxID=127596 RepID=A0ABR3W9K4_9PEZI
MNEAENEEEVEIDIEIPLTILKDVLDDSCKRKAEDADNFRSCKAHRLANGKDHDAAEAAHGLRTSRVLSSRGKGKNLFSDLSKFNATVNSDHFDFDYIRPLLDAVLTDKADNEIWDQVYAAVTESTPPPRPTASSLQETPWLRNTSSFANSSEHCKYMNDVLKEKLGFMYVGLRNFDRTYFGNVADLESASEAFFKQCMKGSNPLFDDGWTGWPKDANQDDVLSWFAKISDSMSTFAETYKSSPVCQQRPLARPNEPIDSSISKRKMDVGFVDDSKAKKKLQMSLVSDPCARRTKGQSIRG